jgi:methylase of polypeptide subunit release factors
MRDVFGWSRPFEPTILPPELFDSMRRANACEPIPSSDLWQPLVRFSSRGELLFAHSPFPTDAQDAVFFGPDSYRFVRALEQHAASAERIVDVGCGSGVGGIALCSRGVSRAPVVLADINAEALRFADVNAQLASVPAELVQSDVLSQVAGRYDLVVANPPYLRDAAHRTYRDGGGRYGEQLAVRITREAIDRLRAMPQGGRLLLYTGAAIVDGNDTFMEAVSDELSRTGVGYQYEELDPDVFPEELEMPAYANVERIAAVFLQVEVARRGSEFVSVAR